VASGLAVFSFWISVEAKRRITVSENSDGGFTMRTGRSEALALFNTWLEDRVLLRVELHLFSVASTLNARLFEVSDTRLRFMSDDRWSELDLPLRDDFTFGYTDMRDFPEEGKEFEHLVVIFFPYEDDPDDAERIVITELKEPVNPRA
jgi:hypothetical protein